MRLFAALLLVPLAFPTAAQAQDADSVLAAQIRRAELHPQGWEVFKEGKKQLKEALKIRRKEGQKAYLEELRKQQRD